MSNQDTKTVEKPVVNVARAIQGPVIKIKDGVETSIKIEGLGVDAEVGITATDVKGWRVYDIIYRDSNSAGFGFSYVKRMEKADGGFSLGSTINPINTEPPSPKERVKYWYPLGGDTQSWERFGDGNSFIIERFKAVPKNFPKSLLRLNLSNVRRLDGGEDEAKPIPEDRIAAICPKLNIDIIEWEGVKSPDQPDGIHIADLFVPIVPELRVEDAFKFIVTQCRDIKEIPSIMASGNIA